MTRKSMRMQTEQKYNKNKIKKLNKEYKEEMVSARITGGHMTAAERK